MHCQNTSEIITATTMIMKLEKNFHVYRKLHHNCGNFTNSDAKVTVQLYMALDVTWVPGEVIELLCYYSLCGPKLRKHEVRHCIKKSKLSNE